MKLTFIHVSFACWLAFLLGGRITSAFLLPQASPHDTTCARSMLTTSLLIRHGEKPKTGGNFWDEKFKGDPELNPSDRIKSKHNRESIDETLFHLEALAAKRPDTRGDYDWDAAYKDDPDWITGDQVPGKMKMTDEQMEAQQRALDALAGKWSSEGYQSSDAPPEDVSEDT